MIIYLSQLLLWKAPREKEMRMNAVQASKGAPSRPRPVSRRINYYAIFEDHLVVFY